MTIWIFIVILAGYIVVTYLMRSGWLFGGMMKPALLRELVERNSRGEEAALVLDVRSPGEYRDGHIPTAINIPHTEIRMSPPSVPRDTRIVVYCQTGTRSLVAKNALRAAGFNAVDNFGRLARWADELTIGEEPGGLARTIDADRSVRDVRSARNDRSPRGERLAEDDTSNGEITGRRPAEDEEAK